MTQNHLDELIENLNENELNALCSILLSLEQSKKKHPNFAENSLIYCSSIIAEEAGEFCRAANQRVYENGKLIDVEVEATHVGAVAIRALCMLAKHGKNVVREKPEETPSLSSYMEAKLKEIKDHTGIQDIAIAVVRPGQLSICTGADDDYMMQIKWIAYLEETLKCLKKYLQDFE